MKSFTISPSLRWYTDPETNDRTRGRFINATIHAYYHDDYHSGNTEIRETAGTVENVITTLKNQFQDKSVKELEKVAVSMIKMLTTDLPQILRNSGKNNLTLCVIPRAKAERSYSGSQLVFKQVVKIVAEKLTGFSDGTGYIVRHTNTRTTHLDRAGYGGDGDLPYPGITIATCTISESVKGKDILLIDDLYTESVNIDEDAIQALLENGANSVTFYSLGKTIPRTQ